MIVWLVWALLGFIVTLWVLPPLVLAWLTKGRISSKHLMHYEVWDEISAELKARRLVREVRRERGGQP